MLIKKLIVLQATPFCNIDCGYCYLPNRNVISRMSFRVLEKIFHEVFKSDYFEDPIFFVWHSGEPLTVPRDYYREAFDLLTHINKLYNRKAVQGIQTNATLINEEWVQLFHQHNIQVSVSLDGPSFIHDRARVNRSGKGTHFEVMRGVRLLQQSGLYPDVIAVLQRFALDYPDEIFDFFLESKIKNIAFNIDEFKGANKETSYATQDTLEAYKRFMRRFIRLVENSNGELNVREFSQFIPILLNPSESVGNSLNSATKPLYFLTFDHEGNINTFCPELSGTRSKKYGNFVMGNILESSIDDVLSNPNFKLVYKEINDGLEACKSSCTYWNVCGGGRPSNKFFELGRFDGTETSFCRFHKQALADVILEHVEKKLHLNHSQTSATRS